jgi:transketolase
MAMAERMLAARFGRSLVDHRTWVIASDGDLMEGISHEAASLAGHLKLGKLTVLFDDNSISIDGGTDLSCSDDVLKRFAAYGWATKRIDGHDPAEIAGALGYAMRSGKPTLIACRTIIGFGAPTKAGTAGSHGAPLGPEEAAAAKAALGWDSPPFTVPTEIAAAWAEAGRRGARERMAWLRRIQKSPQRAEFERVTQGRLPDDWRAGLDAWKQSLSSDKPKIATRQASQKALEALTSPARTSPM